MVQDCGAEGKTCIRFSYGPSRYVYCNLNDGGYPSLGYSCTNNNTKISNSDGVVKNCSLYNQVCTVENDRVKCSTESNQTIDTCTTEGNSTIGNQREYECLSSCEPSSGRVRYEGRNSSCTSGICCRLVVTGGDGTTQPTPAPRLPEPGVGYCADDQRLNGTPIGNPSCTVNNAAWDQLTPNPYCEQNYSGSSEYFYQCPTVTTTPPHSYTYSYPLYSFT